MADNASKDKNFVNSLLGVSSVDGVSTVKLYADPITHRLLTEMGGISTLFQTDVFTSTNNQTIFTASENVAYTIYLSVNGSIQTPNVDYSVTGDVATLTNGIPSNNVVLWVYVTS